MQRRMPSELVTIPIADFLPEAGRVAAGRNARASWTFRRWRRVGRLLADAGVRAGRPVLHRRPVVLRLRVPSSGYRIPICGTTGAIISSTFVRSEETSSLAFPVEKCPSFLSFIFIFSFSFLGRKLLIDRIYVIALSLYC